MYAIEMTLATVKTLKETNHFIFVKMPKVVTVKGQQSTGKRIPFPNSDGVVELSFSDAVFHGNGFGL